jgi:polysaccharide biosynthesis transport protein
MLQTTDPLMTEIQTARESSARDSINWAIGILRRQFWAIVLITLLATGLGATYVFLAPATYTAETTILIDPRRVQLFPGAAFAEGQIDSPAMESQIELLKSEPVLLSALGRLRLTDDPEFIRSKGGFGEALRSISHVFWSNKPEGDLSQTDAVRAALGVITKNLTISRVGFSHLLNIKYRSTNPDRAAQIANAIAEAYIDEQREGKSQSTRSATGWLQERIEELNKKRTLAERAIVDFKQENKMIAAEGKLMTEQQVAELNRELTSSRKQSAEAKARLDRVEVVIRDDGLDKKTSPTVADTLNNPIITQLRTRYLELVGREANWSQKYGANHLAVINLRNQVRDLRGSILDELKRLRESYLSNYEIAKQQEREVEKRLSEAVVQTQTADKAQVPLRELESSAQSYRTMHDNFLQRYTESLQQQSFPYPEARVITPASPSWSKSGPSRALLLFIAAAGGLAFGVAVAGLRELMEGSLFTSEQIESAMQAACISVVPLIEPERSTPNRFAKRMLSFDKRVHDGFITQRTISRDADVFWAVIKSPFSRFSEALRSIKLAIDAETGAAKRYKIVGFTSSLPNEGKSTIAAGVALLMAQAAARVILVDCDLRNPSLSRRLAPNADYGILDVVSGRVSFEDAVWTDPSTGLAFLPAAIKTPAINSSDFLASDAVNKFFADLQSRYDYVLVDLSPLMPVVDARATTGFVDCYLCVVEWGHTKVEALKSAFRDAQDIRENLLGVVLNKANINRLSSYYPIDANHYQNKYYSQYGLTK